MKKMNREIKWEHHRIQDVLGKAVHFKPLHAVNIEKAPSGDLAYVTRTKENNGVEFLLNSANIDEKFINKENAITFGAESGKFFFQNYKFVTGNKMYGFYHKKLNSSNALGLIAILTNGLKLSGFEYGYGMIPQRIEYRPIAFPMHKNELDWEYLEYVVDRETNKVLLDKTTNLIENSIELVNKKWAKFKVSDILTISSGVRLTKANMFSGNRPFIGATDKNNGITEWVSNTNNSLDSNVLGVNYNGSVVENFYHPYEAIFSDDVKRVHIKDKSIEETAEIYLFLKAAFLQHKPQYQYGFKFAAERMKAQSLVLPITEDSTLENPIPDWLFMHKYISSLPNGDLI